MTTYGTPFKKFFTNAFYNPPIRARRGQRSTCLILLRRAALYLLSWSAMSAAPAKECYTIDFQMVARTGGGLDLKSFELIESQWMPVDVADIPFKDDDGAL